jgi:alpha-1,2-mannosyltransferase
LSRIVIIATQYASLAIALAIIVRLPALSFSRHIRYAIAIGLSALIAAFNLIASDPAELFGDFTDAYYPAGVAALNDPQSIGTLFYGVLGFVNIPILAYLFAPFALLDMTPASWIFAVMGVVMAGVAWLIIAREAELDEQSTHLFMLVFVAFGPLAYSIKEGNTTHMVLLALAVALAMLRRGQNVNAGLLLGFAAMIKLPLMLFGVYFLLRRNWQAVFAFGAVCAGISLASLAVFGWELHRLWFDECIRNFSANAIGAFNVQSISAFLIRLSEPKDVLVDWSAYPPGGLQQGIATAAVIGIYLAAIAVCARNGAGAAGDERGGSNRKMMLDFQIVLALSVLTSPLSWSHYYTWLLLPIGFLLSPAGPMVGDTAARRWGWAAILLMMPIVFLLQFPWEWLTVLYAKLLVSHLLAGGLIMLGLLLWLRWQEVSATARASAIPARIDAS